MVDYRRRLISRLLVVPVVAVLSFAGWATASFYGQGPSADEKTVVLPRGAGVKTIAAALEDAGVISNPFVFRSGVRITGNSRGLKAGEYLIPRRTSPRGVMELLLAGRTVLHRLTIAEGLTVAEVFAAVHAVEGLDGEVLERPPEGVLLPETYYFSLGDSRAELLTRMADSMRETLNELWSRRAEGLPFESPEEALSLASIVEKETAVSAERARVAAVFINRLRRGMRLQSDPTVVYSLTQGAKPLGRALTRRDLKTDNPYNTYVNGGLPPGPIANPGRAAIEAVLHPLETDELYFVADGDGGHAFAKTLREHQRNVARWRKVQREKKK
ncbi:MAG: endolytic transglycosylase MltG [Proteobacteria bacterium]|nr:endolytic transglycosylase MltG [Pseudomonadota bacterium]